MAIFKSSLAIVVDGDNFEGTETDRKSYLPNLYQTLLDIFSVQNGCFHVSLSCPKCLYLIIVDIFQCFTVSPFDGAV